MAKAASFKTGGLVHVEFEAKHLCTHKAVVGRTLLTDHGEGAHNACTQMLYTKLAAVCFDSCPCLCTPSSSLAAGSIGTTPTGLLHSLHSSPALAPSLLALACSAPPRPSLLATASSRATASGKRRVRARHSGEATSSSHCSAMRAAARRAAAVPVRCARLSAASSCRAGRRAAAGHARVSSCSAAVQLESPKQRSLTELPWMDAGRHAGRQDKVRFV